MRLTPIGLAFTSNYNIPAVTARLYILDHCNASDEFEIICLLAEELDATIISVLDNWNSNRLRFKRIYFEDKFDGVYTLRTIYYCRLLPATIARYSA